MATYVMLIGAVRLVAARKHAIALLASRRACTNPAVVDVLADG